MFKRTGLLIIIFSTFINYFYLNAQDLPMKIVLLDTAGREKWLYKPLIDILETVGWKVDYRSIDEIMDRGPKSLNLSNYKAVFFLFGFEFLKGASKSPVAAKIMMLMQQYCSLSGRLVGFIFPPLNAQSGVNLISNFAPIFKTIGINTPRQQLAFPNLDAPTENVELTKQKSLDAFFYVANTFLSHPIESRPLDYQTTLNEPHPGINLYTKEIDKILQASDIYLKLLPINQQFSQIIKQTFPYGLYWFNPICNNHIFIAQPTIFSFSGISESFHFCPADYVLRKEINNGVLHMIWDVTQLVKELDHEKLKKNIISKKILDLPAEITLPWYISSQGSLLEREKQQIGTEQIHKIAWMETNVFETTDEQKQNQLIDYIVTSGLDTIWLSCTPNIYFSTIARNKNNTCSFLNGLGCFTKKLNAITKQKNKPLPKIFIGFEITNNLYEPNLPKQCSVDLYGNLYQDLPSSLDRSFWKNEIKKPLTDFLMQWKDKKISNGIHISGVVIDLEMYCRKTSSEFLTCMGFDQVSFARFTCRHKLNYKNMSPHEKVSLLMENKQTSQYFSFLEQDAEQLGAELKKFFNKKIPYCSIACYTPNIIINWFYKGLYKGLCNKKQPLQLFTFNSEFQGHKEWFEVNKLSVQHSSVLLLSKIKEQKDFTWIDSILQHHNGVWLNRFSRMVEPKVADWGAIERPAIDDKVRGLFCQHINNIQ